jgi:eukaryotic-like serine/threonine-protein kinase
MTEKTWANLKDIFAKTSEMEESQRAQYLDEVCADNPALRSEVESLLASFEKSNNFIEQPAFQAQKALSWQRVSDVLSQVLELPKDQRLEYAKELCGGDAELFGEVSSLLASEKNTADFLNQSPFASAGLLDNLSAIKEKSIGNYKILKEIGHGGMGVVYLAARNDEIRQRVALKLVKRGLDSKEVLRRFKNERQILASLHHPNISQLLDGGTTDDGTPFFVMEYVEGLPLIEYCREKQLSTNERLDLFKTICSAVQHAHQNLVIHRDLKPANILVTHEGEVKLLDFGVAKFLNPELAGELNQTQTQFRVMTPEYASPEQIRGAHITTSSDIYSLGVILYELLTGERPFTFEGKSLEQMMQAVTQSEPLAPSVVIKRHGDTTGTRGRGEKDVSVSPRLQVSASQLNGDLDNIVLMALRKEPVRRYQSVSDFSEDIQRYLKGLPVSARPNTFSYRAEKFIRRNLAASVIGGLLILSLIAGLGFSIWQARIAARERDRAIAEQNKAESVNRFMSDILQAASPDQMGKDAKILDVLADAEQNAETNFAAQPELKAQAYLTLGKTYSAITEYDKADVLLRKALQISESLPAENPITPEVLINLAGNSLAQSKLEKVEEYLTRGIEMERRLSPNGSRNLALGLQILAEYYSRSGNYVASLPPATEAANILSKITNENDVDFAFTISNLGRSQFFNGDLVNSEINLKKGIAVLKNYSGKYDGRMTSFLLNLGLVLSAKGQFEEALKTLAEANQLADKINLPTYKFYARNYTCNTYAQMQNWEKVIEFCSQSLQIFPSTNLAEANDNFVAYNNLGLALTRTGKAAEGEPNLRKALSITEKLDPNDNTGRITLAKSALGENLLAQNKIDEAKLLIEETFPKIKEKFGDKNYYTISALKRLITLYEKTNNQELAEKFRAELP